jgi:hypothetical protein
METDEKKAFEYLLEAYSKKGERTGGLNGLLRWWPIIIIVVPLFVVAIKSWSDVTTFQDQFQREIKTTIMIGDSINRSYLKEIHRQIGESDRNLKDKLDYNFQVIENTFQENGKKINLIKVK